MFFIVGKLSLIPDLRVPAYDGGSFPRYKCIGDFSCVFTVFISVTIVLIKLRQKYDK